MDIYYSDEDGRITPNIESLMKRAAGIAIHSELVIDECKMDIERLPMTLSVTIVNKEEIQDLNREYRGIDKTTDVLSFPQFGGIEEIRNLLIDYCDASNGLDIDSELPEILLGDVVICYDVAEDQAEIYGTGITREIIYLFVHSIFHLLGYDHENDEERTDMRIREEKTMNMIGVNR